MFQSYSAYSEGLAGRNREYLSGSAAPEWVLFAPQPIDDSYPNVEDGPSWVEMIHRLEPVTTVGDKVRLSPAAPTAGGDPLQPASVHGEKVALPASDGLRFVTFDIEPSRFGLAAFALYKYESLRLTVWTADGVERSWRLPLGMAPKPAFPSPR
ncbi:hypothetical protein ASH01_06795 [Terrabacter sp. Soil811]|uniref:hypothetical protein n=1 Tax=Terrabacter sp. Soil811 TaxID=1736419 RepID=UPI0006F340C4|nr:hypothetical protein [Terrabacter sp. Soil811]KRF45527.1 hypothetical protein ASH01_06795 [Terrabacter sp. Soil811]